MKLTKYTLITDGEKFGVMRRRYFFFFSYVHFNSLNGPWWSSICLSPGCWVDINKAATMLRRLNNDTA